MPSTSKKGYFGERWLKIHCQVVLGIDMSGFRIIGIGNCDPQEESDNDRLSGELVPIIFRDQFEKEAERFLERYCPEALEKPICLPIDQIAELEREEQHWLMNVSIGTGISLIMS